MLDSHTRLTLQETGDELGLLLLHRPGQEGATSRAKGRGLRGDRGGRGRGLSAQLRTPRPLGSDLPLPAAHLPKDEAPGASDAGLLRAPGCHLDHLRVEHGQPEWRAEPAAPRVHRRQRWRDGRPCRSPGDACGDSSSGPLHRCERRRDPSGRPARPTYLCTGRWWSCFLYCPGSWVAQWPRASLPCGTDAVGIRTRTLPDDPRLRQRGLAQSTPLPQTSPGCPPTPASQGPLPPPSLHRPPHADTAQVRVQVEERPDAEGLRHDVAERRPLGGFQAEQTQNQLAQLRAVSVRDGREGTAHDL